MICTMAGRTQRRGRILSAARSRLLAHGYSRASLRAIAADSGVTTGAIYHHFGSKDGLLAAVCLEGLGRLARRLDTAAQLTQGRPLAERFTEVLDAYSAHFLEDRGDFALFEQLGARAPGQSVPVHLAQELETALARIPALVAQTLGRPAGPDALVVMCLAEGLFTLERQGQLARLGHSLASVRGLLVDRAGALVEKGTGRAEP